MIRIGPAGTGGDTLLGIESASKKGLLAVEIEFTHGVHMKNELARQAGELASKLGMELTIHAPYFINLASAEKIKIRQSEKRILDSCERGHHMGARYVVFHAAFYGKLAHEETYGLVVDSISRMQETIKSNGWKVILAPETTGKASQFGDLDELLMLRKDVGCHLCVDFAHLLARTGKIDYDDVFSKLKDVGHIHSHFSGIEYGEKGERRHLLTGTKEIKELFIHVLKHKSDITIINESPDPFGDAEKMVKILEEMK